jgi:hypothetical protein
MAYPSPNEVFGYFIFFLPGIISFFVYRFYSDKNFGKLDRLDVLLILTFTFLNKAVTRFEVTNGTIDYTDFIEILRIDVLTQFLPGFMVSPIILLISSAALGVLFDILHRVLVSEEYRYRDLLTLFDKTDADTVDIPIWEKRLREEYISSKNIKESKKIIITLETEEELIGYLSGWSNVDLEITDPQYDESDEHLIFNERWVPKEKILHIEFLNETMEDNYEFR